MPKIDSETHFLSENVCNKEHCIKGVNVTVFNEFNCICQMNCL